MATADYTIVVDNSVAGISIVHSMNEDAFNFITEELEYGALPNGDVAIDTADVDTFIYEAELSHLWSVIQ